MFSAAQLSCLSLSYFLLNQVLPILPAKYFYVLKQKSFPYQIIWKKWWPRRKYQPTSTTNWGEPIVWPALSTLFLYFRVKNEILKNLRALVRSCFAFFERSRRVDFSEVNSNDVLSPGKSNVCITLRKACPLKSL